MSAVADVALEIILVDETMQPITQADIADWVKMFTKVDVVDVLSKIRKTCIHHPSKRKDGDGIRSHIVGCLKMMQERQESFEGIWKRYPDKDGKKEAEKHFRSTVHTVDDLRDIHKALDNYLAVLEDTPGRRPKGGKVWFNNWKDWVSYEKPIYGGKTKKGASDDDLEKAFFGTGEKVENDFP